MRREFDYYATKSDLVVGSLLKNIEIKGTILECCDGNGDISSRILKSLENCQIYTNDIDKSRLTNFYLDVSLKSSWDRFPPVDWVITNPPFNLSTKIVPLAYKHATKGIAMFLRTSWIEPCKNRREMLQNHPINYLISCPRLSFTGDGGKDTLNCSWFVWEKGAKEQKIITVF